MKTEKEQLEKKLTEKQNFFCLEYLKDFNGTAAAIRAGYSKKTAYAIAEQNLRKLEINKYIEILKSERVKRTELDLDYVLDNIVEVIERCMEHKLITDDEGNPILIQTTAGETAAVCIFNSGGALKGLELLGKHVGLEKKDAAAINNNALTINITNFTKDDPTYNQYFPVTPETEHLAKLLGINSEFRPKKD